MTSKAKASASPVKGKIKTKVPAKQELWQLLFELGRVMKREIYKEGVTLPSFLHVETLRYIEEQGAPTMREVADYLKIAPPSATALTNALVKEGVITRSTDSVDRRIVRLAASKKGHRLLEDVARKREEAFSRVVASLSVADRKELSRILTIITRNPNLNH